MAARAAGLHSFCPTDDELINRYLRSKISGGDNYSFPFINEASVYSKPPHQLVTEHAPAPGTGGHGVWYFFTRLCRRSENQTRCSRMVGEDGRWHPEIGKHKGKVEGTLGGCLKKFSYLVRSTASSSSSRRRRSSRWVRSGWVMAEYSDDGMRSAAGDTVVLCKLYRSSSSRLLGSGPGAHPTTIRTTRRRDLQRGVPSGGDNDHGRRAAASSENYHHHQLAGSHRSPAAAGVPPQLAPGGPEGHRSRPPLQLGPHEAAAERFLMADDDDDAMMIPYGEDTDAFYESYLLGGGGGGGQVHDGGQQLGRRQQQSRSTTVPAGAGAMFIGSDHHQITTTVHGRNAHDDVFASLAARGYVDEWLATESAHGECSRLLPGTQPDY